MNETLVLDNVRKSWGEDLFAPVSIRLGPGGGLGIVGHNGSGKTTLLDIIAQIERPTKGSVKVCGSLAYVMQQASFQESLSFKDNLLLEAHLCGLRGAEASEQARLAAARLEILPFWAKRCSRGSSGMRGRLSIAAALLASPQVLLLDEVYNFLDERSQEQVHHVLLAEKERGATLVMVSHDRGHFSGLCESVLALPRSEITALKDDTRLS